MNLKWFLVLVGSAFLLLVLVSCGSAGTPAGTPTCPPANLQAPVLTSPAEGAVEASLSPSLSWSYPDTGCTPQGYAVRLTTGPLFTDNLGGSTGSSSTTWSPGSPLMPGKEYSWSIQAINGTTSGPFAGDGYFFTGPTCDPASLVSPDLLQPLDGSVITTLNPSLIWQYPDACLPEGYRVDLSTDAAFAGTSLGGTTGNPSSHWAPGNPLADCTTFFWKISPVNGTSLGPSSDVLSFNTNVTGTCFSPTPAASSTPNAPTSTPTPAQLTFTTNINAYCLLGPDRSFKVLEIAMMGQPYVMEGRDKDNRWYKITVSDRVSCWVSMFSGRASGDPSTLPVLPEVPLPTATPIICTSQTKQSCETFSFCKWYSTGTIDSGYCDKR